MFIQHRDAKIFATAFGAKKAPALLAVGGWIGSWEDWIEPLSILSEETRVLAYDHRGSGITQSPINDITFDQMVDDVVLVLDAYQVRQCTLAAMSMGSMIALGAALRYPDRITGLVLASPMDMREKSGDAPDKFLHGLTHAYPQALEGFIQACVPEPDSEHIKAWGRHILNRASQEAAITLYQLSKHVPIRAQFPTLMQPTLILHGDRDLVAPLDSARWLSEQLPNAHLEVIEGAGHVPILTRPEYVAQHIQHFLLG